MTHDIDAIGANLRQAASLPAVLAASFDAFEVIRRLARQCDSNAPGLFASFMSAAGAAADGRDAITAAPALASPGCPAPKSDWTAGPADPEAAADVIAALATVLAGPLDHATSLGVTPLDRLACVNAAQLARQIHQLMAPADDAHAR